MSKRDEYYSIKSICSMKVVNYVDELEAEKAELYKYLRHLYDSGLVKSMEITMLLNKFKEK